MPHIEVIPITHGGPAPAPGWAYVPDIGYDPSKAAINPSGRKRTAARQSQREADADLPARQQTAILKRIAELDRDNQKDVALPQARGGAAASGAGTVSKREREGRKMTPAVRKILQSGRTFAHWLADEEALAAQRTGVRAAAATATATDSAPTTPLANAVGSPAPPPQQTPVVDLESGIQQHHDPPDDDEPLLRPTVPQLPTEAEIQTLLAHPPLPYSAARAAPPGADGASRRLFCEICGYWGRVRCLRCAARICGLECKRAHDETSCLRM
ncbi:HIT finger domain-containing protein [Phyllosticta capitalensis]